MRFSINLLLVFMLLTLAAGEAMACKCSIKAREFNHAVKASSLVFLGKLVEISQVYDSPIFFSATYKFVPLKTWRGESADTLMLQTGSNCNIRLQAGSTYVLYINPGTELTNCHRIISQNLQAEIKKLDKYFVKPRPLQKHP
ncbi:hypothetical protein [Hymenobacter guriensis]|uniref:NTR domain-containing protein n=1 Tax=Hymenobacter guriensis TaxID=2793065 RepID=A0ABS0L447_9BACT|nr:hypothetical protein [Hymenobacter guriensis]MBG8554915.1 hypothetical protein [Hymenobacter guriensis]